jgi:hypothetical protein
MMLHNTLTNAAAMKVAVVAEGEVTAVMPVAVAEVVAQEGVVEAEATLKKPVHLSSQKSQ